MSEALGNSEESLSPRHSLRRAIAVVTAVWLVLIVTKQDMRQGKAPDWDSLCVAGQPYFVASSYRAQSKSDRAPSMDAPAVILFQDTPSDRIHYNLASYSTVGTVWGLAYRRSDQTVFAGAYAKRALPFGPLGAGGVYRINLASGIVDKFLTVPNAGTSGRRTSMSIGDRRIDQNTVKLVGKIGLGGLDISDDESRLFVMNLNDRRIYHYELPSGKLIGSFDVGSMQEPWSMRARPFALTYHGGKLYHGVVNDSGIGDDFVARVYRTDADGTGLETVATLDLRYLRDGVRLQTVSGVTTKWGGWTDPSDLKPGDPPLRHIPGPMLTDIVFAENGTMVLGLRDRYSDQVVPWIKEEYTTVTPFTQLCFLQLCTPVPAPPTPAVYSMAEEALGFGDLLHADPREKAFEVRTDPEFFDDGNALGHGESAFGGLTCVSGTNNVVATIAGVDEAASSKGLGKDGAYWYDATTGAKVGREAVGQPGSFRDYGDLLKQQFLRVFAHDGEPTVPPTEHEYKITTRIFYNRDTGSLGDIEALCVNCGILPTPTPLPPSETPVPTDTPTTEPTPMPPSDTPTFTSTPTLTAVPPTITSTPLPKPIYLPIALLERCDPGHARGDIVLVIDTSSSMEGAKIQAARTAAHEFVRALTLPEDQVGIVTFNATAKILSRLTGNAAGLHIAIDQITTAPGTRIDTGLALAIELLAGPERKASNSPVVIVMTDGLQAAEPERPQELAAQLRSSGVVIYAIGLGTDVDAAYLTRLAGDASRMKLSPTSAELTAIYLQIARLIPCAPSSFWGGR